jgi:sugar O-acyltransferase (sialic acid O-acetyltransferase NeuD family)
MRIVLKKVIIFGNSSFAHLAYYYFLHDSDYQIVAFTVNKDYVTKKTLFGLPVIPFETIEKKYPPSEYKMFIAIGYSAVNKNRANKYRQAKKKGYQLVSYISSKANYWDDLQIGDNCFIQENQLIQPFVKIGNNVIINGGGYIGHNSIIHDHCYFSAGVILGGNVIIEPYNFIGLNAVIKDNIKILKNGIIGVGSVVISDTQEKGVYSGNPAKLYYNNSSKIKI